MKKTLYFSRSKVRIKYRKFNKSCFLCVIEVIFSVIFLLLSVIMPVLDEMDLASRLIISAGVIIIIFFGLCFLWISNKSG